MVARTLRLCGTSGARDFDTCRLPRLVLVGPLSACLAARRAVRCDQTLSLNGTIYTHGAAPSWRVLPQRAKYWLRHPGNWALEPASTSESVRFNYLLGGTCKQHLPNSAKIAVDTPWFVCVSARVARLTRRQARRIGVLPSTTLSAPRVTGPCHRHPSHHATSTITYTTMTKLLRVTTAKEHDSKRNNMQLGESTRTNIVVSSGANQTLKL